MTNPDVTISVTTKKILKKIRKLPSPSVVLFDVANDNYIEREKLIVWMNKEFAPSKDEQFLFDSLYAAVLIDLNNSLLPKKLPPPPKKKISKRSVAKLILLILAGIIFYGCEGFDGITAILSITILPPLIIFGAGIIFSILSVTIFFVLDLVEISKNLGIDLVDAPEVVNIYTQQIDMIKSIRKKIDAIFSKNNNIEEIENDILLLTILINRYHALEDYRAVLKKFSNNSKLEMAKIATGLITGIIFFSGGFYAGQTVALAFAGLIGVALSGTAAPILITSIIVGLAALCIYWFVEKPGMESLIGQFIGLDKEKIEQLIDEDFVENDINKLIELKDKLESKRSNLYSIKDHEDKIKTLTEDLAPANITSQRTHSLPTFFAPFRENLADEVSSPQLHF